MRLIFRLTRFIYEVEVSQVNLETLMVLLSTYFFRREFQQQRFVILAIANSIVPETSLATF
jgi:hypothetical protein